jgi:glycosyltransferase involved in cell wall biosynthesis
VRGNRSGLRLGAVSDVLADRLALREVRQVLGRLRPDIVQVNSGILPWLLPLGATGGARFCFDVRQINEQVDSSLRAIVHERSALGQMRLAARATYDHTFFCHELAAARVLGPRWSERATVIPVAVEKEFLPYAHAPVERRSPVVTFIYVGTLSPLRNLDRLIEAARRLVDQGIVDFQMTLVGPDRTNGFLERTVHELDVARHVRIDPPRPYEEIPGLLAGFDVGLAYVPDRPTWHYQPTIKVLEYRALGLPILSTDVQSHRGIVVDGVNGVMVADDPDAIAAGMSRFIRDRAFLASTVQRAREMRSGMTWSDVADAYLLKYRDLALEAGHVLHSRQKQ